MQSSFVAKRKRTEQNKSILESKSVEAEIRVHISNWHRQLLDSSMMITSYMSANNRHYVFY